MAVTLTSAIGPGDGEIAITGGPLPVDTAYVQIDSEILYIRSAATSWIGAARGALGSKPAPHALGATLYHVNVAVSSAVPFSPPLPIGTTAVGPTGSTGTTHSHSVFGL